MSLPQVDLVELLDSGRGRPAAPERRRVARLAGVREPRLDLLLDHFPDIHLEIRFLARETPGLGGLMRVARIRIRQRIARARPCGVERDPADDAVIGVIAVAAERIGRASCRERVSYHV